LKTFAQNVNVPEVDLKKLELTNSPAFVLLGIQPTNITRPSTPREFSVGIQNSNINGVIQPGLAMEFNPFTWGQNDKNNLFIGNEYFDKKVWPSIKKNFSFSLATSATDTTSFGELEKGTGLGFGFRATIIPGTVNKKTIDLFYFWALTVTKESFLRNLSNSISKLSSDENTVQFFTDALENEKLRVSNWQNVPESFKKQIYLDIEFYAKSISYLTEKAILDDFIGAELLEVDLNKRKSLKEIDARKIPFAREGFILEVAYSGVYHLQNNVWDNAVFAKSGLWLTPSYRVDFSKNDDFQSIDFLGIARYLWNDKLVDKTNYFDSGFKLQYNRNNLSASVEGIYRYASTLPEGVKSKWTNSWIANINYLITEDISVRFSFGSKFNGNTTTFDQPQGLIVMGGLNFDIPGLSK
jgi:hypothetical protein